MGALRGGDITFCIDYNPKPRTKAHRQINQRFINWCIYGDSWGRQRFILCYGVNAYIKRMDIWRGGPYQGEY